MDKSNVEMRNNGSLQQPQIESPQSQRRLAQILVIAIIHTLMTASKIKSNIFSLFSEILYASHPRYKAQSEIDK